ncbi:MAG: acyltransferase family protein, partial [Actinomycetota bacterium]
MPVEGEASGRSGRRRAAVPHRPGIDGLRALAVAAVVAYHAEATWLPAGFLGVDVFFVISGYLICSLILAEHDQTGQVSLGAFWRRRARRLLPALFALLAGVTVAAIAVAPDAVSRLRGDVVAALAYVSNWWQIIGDQSYFDSFGRPPLLRHLWSLAVEEQFYLVFPVAMAVGLRVFGRHRGALVAAAVALGGASALLMAAMFSPADDPSRVYYGTDTRAVGLFAGVALAAVWPPGRLQETVRTSARVVLDGLGVLSVVALVALMGTLGDASPGLYRGGFAVTAVASAVAIAVAAHPASRFGQVLSREPFQWIGTRSYAIYLWHWPVFMVTRPDLDMSLRGVPLLGLRLAATGLLAEASWRLVEQPVRSGAALRWWREAGGIVRARAVLGGAVTCLLVAGGLLVAAPPAPPELLADGETAVVPVLPPEPSSTVPTSAPPTTVATTATTAPPTTATIAPAVSPPTTKPAPTTAPAPPPPPPEGAVLAIGDSVMLSGRYALTAQSAGNVYIDARVARQADEGIDALQGYRDRGELARFSAVVIHLGTNGPLRNEHFARLAQLVEGVPRVVVVNVRVPRRWEGESNGTIGGSVPQHPAMRLADWYAASGEPGTLGSDGVHPTRRGAEV